MSRKIISTAAAPAAIGTYSQAVQVGDTIYMSGQIGLDPATMTMVEGIDAQIVRVFDNLKAVAEAAGASLNDAVKLNIYLVNVGDAVKIAPARKKWLGDHAPPGTLIYVKALAYPELLLEVEGIAVKHG